MAPVETAAMVVLACGASLFTAWTIGAGSSGATPFAPAVAANAIGTMRAAFVVGLLGLAGAVLQGANVTETVGRELIHGVAISPVAATIALATAAGLIAAGVFRGYPIATAFAVAGTVVGVGVALGGDPAWRRYGEIVGFWVLTPFVGAPAAYATARLLRGDRLSEGGLVALLAAFVGVVVANMGFTLLGRPDEAASLATVAARRLSPVLPPWVTAGAATLAVAGVSAAWVRREGAVDRVRSQRRFLLALGALVAFSAGGGKVGLAIGPLLPLVGALPVRVPILAVLGFGGFGLLAGSWMAATRMIKALSQDYSDLGPRRSIAILVPSFAIAQVGIALGIPMSFNEIFISAIAGSGYAAGGRGISRRKFGYTVLAWVGSLVLGFAISFGLQSAVAAVE